MHKTAFKMQHETGAVFIITSKWPIVPTNNCCLNKSNAISFCYVTSNSTIDTNTEGSFRRNEEITIIPFRRKKRERVIYCIMLPLIMIIPQILLIVAALVCYILVPTSAAPLDDHAYNTGIAFEDTNITGRSRDRELRLKKPLLEPIGIFAWVVI